MLSLDDFEVIQSDNAVVRADYPEYCYRVRYIPTGDESSLMSRDDCLKVIDHAIKGELLGSFLIYT